MSVYISMLGVVHVCLELNGSVWWCRDVDCDTIPFMWPVDWYTSGFPVHSDRVDLLRMLCKKRQRCCIMFVGILGSSNEHDHANSW